MAKQYERTSVPEPAVLATEGEIQRGSLGSSSFRLGIASVQKGGQRTFTAICTNIGYAGRSGL